MKKLIVITTQFEALHKWKDCDILSVGFLGEYHRHIFHVTMKWEVKDNDREIEFISKKREVNSFIKDNWEGRSFLYSCEDFAEKLLIQFKASFVSVFEDNENGAQVSID